VSFSHSPIFIGRKKNALVFPLEHFNNKFCVLLLIYQFLSLGITF
jgi:hypothetical protein